MQSLFSCLLHVILCGCYIVAATKKRRAAVCY
nr:MAG TPA: hypothetical protein [Caudoviricetes sp.]